MKEQWIEKAWAIIALALALSAAGCGLTPTAPPTPSPTQPPPMPTQPAASESPVSAAGDVLGVWQVEGAAGDPLLLVFNRDGKFGAFAGSQQLDYGVFIVKEEQMILTTSLKACRLCKGSYRVYVTQQAGQPARLRFVSSGQDANAVRAPALDGKTATWQPGALPGEAPLGAVEDVIGTWEARETTYGTSRLTFNSNGKYGFAFATEGVWSGGFSAADGKLVFDPGTPDTGSYAVFVRKQGGKVVQLRFVLLNDTDPEVRPGVLQLNPLTPAEP
jgi:hypothetical protein